MSNRNDVEIDYCPECRGVWLDRGELDKIIDRSIPSQAQYDSRESRQHHTSDSDYHKKKRKESFLGDLFDF